MKKLGILGGMGPLAGAYFYQRVIENTKATCDAEHIPVFLIGDPTIPDRTAHLLGEGQDPFPALLTAALTLREMGAEVIAMPCNTAHAYLPRLREAVSLPFLDMPYLAVESLAKAGRLRIGVLSTRGTLLSKIYQRAAAEFGGELLVLPPFLSERLERRIYAQKGGVPTAREAYMPYAEHLLDEGADAVILGCTEISAAFSGEMPPFCTDALEVLARTSVAFCGEVGEGVTDYDVRRAFAG